MDRDFWMQRKVFASIVFSLFLGLLIGAGVVHFSSGISQAEASELVSEAFSAGNQSMEVASVERESPSVYRVIVDRGEGLENVFVTSDGEFILNNPVRHSEYIESVSGQYDFNTCLGENNVSIIGSSQQQLTQQQLQVLGGVGLEELYVEADQQMLQQLNTSGVQNLPVTVYNGQFFEGVRGESFYSELTGCSR